MGQKPTHFQKASHLKFAGTIGRDSQKHPVKNPNLYDLPYMSKI